MDLNESISNDWTFMKRQIKPPLKIIGRENTDNIILVERNVHKWGVALRSSNPVSLSSRTNMAIQTLQLQIKVITVITKVCLSWPKINATELHFARSFQGYPTRPYLEHSNVRPKFRIWCDWPYSGAYLSGWHCHLRVCPGMCSKACKKGPALPFPVLS